MNVAHRLSRNALANWSALAVGVIASLVLAPYLLGHLGNERFGLYQIGRQFTMFLFLFDLGILGAVMRFSGQSIAAGDDLQVSRIVSSATVLYGGIAMLGIVVSGLAAFTAPGFFGADPSHAAQTRWLFWGLGGEWALLVLACPAKAILIGHQRYELIAAVTVGTWAVTLTIIFGLFEAGYDSLIALVVAFGTAAGFQLLALTMTARRIHPALRWARRHVEVTTVRSLCGFGAWNLLFTVAGLFLWSSDSIVIGRVLGPSIVPLYAIPFMLITAGRAVVEGLSGPLTPLASSYSVHDPAGLRAALERGTRTALVLALAINGTLIVLAEDLLRLWIGPEYAASWLVYACLMASFWAVYAQMPAYNILLGAGDIRGPAVAVMLASASALAIKIVATGWLGFGIVAVALGNCVTVLPVMAVYMPLCAARLTGMPLHSLYRRAYLPPLLGFVPVAALGWLAVAHRPPANLVELAAYGAVLATLYLIASYGLLDADERNEIARWARLPSKDHDREHSR